MRARTVVHPRKNPSSEIGGMQICSTGRNERGCNVPLVADVATGSNEEKTGEETKLLQSNERMHKQLLPEAQECQRKTLHVDPPCDGNASVACEVLKRKHRADNLFHRVFLDNHPLTPTGCYPTVQCADAAKSWLANSGRARAEERNPSHAKCHRSRPLGRFSCEGRAWGIVSGTVFVIVFIGHTWTAAGTSLPRQTATAASICP